MKTLIIILTAAISFSCTSYKGLNKTPAYPGYGVTTPAIRINSDVKDIEVALCNNDSTMYFSFFRHDDSRCVEQEIAFLDSSEEWVSQFVVREMGFVPGDSSYIKKIPTGFLSAKVKPSIVDYHGEQQATSFVISLYEYSEEE